VGDKLSNTARLARWKIFVTKLFWVLANYAMKQRTVAVLGRSTYLRVFQQIKKQGAQTAETVTRIIQGEIVGKAISPAEGTQNVEPHMCQHPMFSMKQRGNKTSKWWTCIQCLSRWERRSLADSTPDGQPTDQEISMFGKHQGKTFSWILEQDAAYCQWVLMTMESSGESCSNQFRRLAQYLIQAEHREAQKRTAEDPVVVEDGDSMSDDSWEEPAKW